MTWSLTGPSQVTLSVEPIVGGFDAREWSRPPLASLSLLMTPLGGFRLEAAQMRGILRTDLKADRRGDDNGLKWSSRVIKGCGVFNIFMLAI